MFIQTGPNQVISDEGYSVKRTKRHELSFAQADKYIFVEVEPGEGLAIYESSISEWSSGEKISPDEKKAILEKISRALDFLNTKHVIR